MRQARSGRSGGPPFVEDDDGVRDLRRPLTKRELEVLELLAAGFPRRAIGDRLLLSPKTVGTHTERIFMKLGVHSREQAVFVARRNELLQAPADPR